MTISFVASASNTNSGSTTPTITHGLTLVVGDVIIAVVNINSTASITSDSSEFDKDETQTYNGAIVTCALFSRVIDGTEGSTFDWTLGSSARWGVAVQQFRGVSAGPYDVAPAVGNFTDNTGDAVLTNITVADGAMAIVASGASVGGNGYTSIDNSYINAESPGTNADVFMANRLYATGVTTSDTTMDVPFGSTDWGAWHFSLVGAEPAAPVNELAMPEQTIAIGVAYSFDIAPYWSGNPAPTYTAEDLPAGLSINSAGVISGTPT